MSRDDKEICCRTCRFYDDPRCKRNAPSPSTQPGYLIAHWPYVQENDWCGEHKARDLK